MSVQREGQYVTFVCDQCGDEIDLGRPFFDFHEALAEAKERGMKMGRVADEWEHYCDAACKSARSA